MENHKEFFEKPDPRFENEEQALAYNIADRVFFRIRQDGREQTLKGDDLEKAIFSELEKEEDLKKLDDDKLYIVADRLYFHFGMKDIEIKPAQIASIKDKISQQKK